jgi:UDP-N-acetyl-D-glucosamine dehydrogenase
VSRQRVCVQGLGYVGAAMAVACARVGAQACGKPYFDVVGLDLDTASGRQRIDAINSGTFPFETTDQHLLAETEAAVKAGNLRASSDASVIADSDIVVVDVHFDIGDLQPDTLVDFAPFRQAIRTIGERIAPDALVVVETTVLPGTCERVVRPELDLALERRGLPRGGILLAHSYERVMPGADYLASITDYWRVFAGETKAAGDACEAFLSKVIKTADFPLTRLDSLTASEVAKVLENTYRAVNIAFIDEWTQFAERIGVDLFQVVNAIRLRPTHSNIRQPGFGVGGYCLTKDPLFGPLAARELFGLPELSFSFSQLAVAVNQHMPLHVLAKIRSGVGGSLSGKSILLAGVSYRADVGDTRYSPAETLSRAAREEGAILTFWDPLLSCWEEMDAPVARTMTACPDVDAVVFAVAHKEFRDIQPEAWLSGRAPLIIDANDVLTPDQRAAFVTRCTLQCVGRG